MLRFILIPIMLIAISASYGATLYKTGDMLLLQCQSSESVDILGCINYIEGASDQIELMRDDRRKTNCIPSGVKGQQLRDIVVDYFQAHPESRRNAAALGLKAAFSQAWNCK